MTKHSSDYLEHCLYFTANSLSRVITRMADEEFAAMGMSTSHAFLLMITIEEPGITQKALSGHLNLAQSTVSRFVDSLVHKGFLEKVTQGKLSKVYPTPKGQEQLGLITQSWRNLYQRYCDILGEKPARKLTQDTIAAYRALIDTTP